MIRLWLCRFLLPLCAVLIGLAGRVAACPFCGGQGQTLSDEVKEASLVIYGTLANARNDANGAGGQGTTDLHIEAVIKDHAVRGGKKVVTLPRYLPIQDKSIRFLVFCGVFQGKIDPYRGLQVKQDCKIVDYLQGCLDRKNKPLAERLRFAFDYLDNPELEVSNDAYKEFANSDYKDYRPMAKDLAPAKLAGWLADPETPAFRFGLYASLLGHCGTPKDAALLRQLLDDKKRRLSSGVDGVLAGYTMLQPKEGWAYIEGMLKDPKQEFLRRYAALRAARFLWSERPDLVEHDTIVKGVLPVLAQTDMADFAIEDLRKWGRWEVAGAVLKLYGEKSHNIPIIRRAIVRYALCCPQIPEAEAFIKELRGKEPDFVNDAEALLKLEQTPAPKVSEPPVVQPKK